jgi:uncharacterized protein
MNPFSYGSIVKGDFFFDREEECGRIVATLSGGNNLVMLAPRRYGKTSLVFRSVELLEKMGYTCIYFDFMPVFSKESFIVLFSKALLSGQSNLQIALKKAAALIKGAHPTLTFNSTGVPSFSINFTDDKVNEETLDSILDLPEHLASDKKKFIIIFDEFQEINKLNGENFENLLRSKIQMHQNVNYLFLGSRTHMLNEMFSNKSRAFYNSASIMQITELPLANTITFLQNRFALNQLSINDEAATYLVNEAGRIPYYIQLLASEIWQTLVLSKAEVDHFQIDEGVKRIVDLKSDYYYELYDHLTAYQKKLLLALLADDSGIFSAEFARKNRLSAASTTQKALAGLVDSGIVEKLNSLYFISDPFFKRYLLRYAI